MVSDIGGTINQDVDMVSDIVLGLADGNAGSLTPSGMNVGHRRSSSSKYARRRSAQRSASAASWLTAQTVASAGRPSRSAAVRSAATANEEGRWW